MTDPNIEKYIQAFSNIHTNVNHTNWAPTSNWRAPHKPFLLLSVFDLISKKMLQSNFITVTSELENIFSRYWKCVMPEHAGNIVLPFFHLKGDNFWHLIPQPGKESTLKYIKEIDTLSQLNKLVKGAKLDNELFQLLQAEDHRSKFRNVIIKSCFESNIQDLIFTQGISISIPLINNQQPAENEIKLFSNKDTKIVEEKNNQEYNDQLFADQFKNLVYFSDNEQKPKPLPNWAKYFLELGSSLSCYENGSTHFIVAVTIPIRAFAASFIATGLIVSRLNLQVVNNKTHIKKIENLPMGTPVFYRTKNKRIDGIFNGTISCQNKRYFLIKYQKGGEISIPIEKGFAIEVSEKCNKKLPSIQSGRQLTPPSPLLKSLFGKEILSKLMAESILDCVILGQQNSFHKELCELQLGLKIADNEIADGKLVDIVRPRGTQFQSLSLSYRSHILSSSRKYSLQYTTKLNNYVTIFDNPLGFLKWRSYYKYSNWIVILDKTANNYDLAIKDINEEYIQNRLETKPKISLPNPPLGVELMVFEVAS